MSNLYSFERVILKLLCEGYSLNAISDIIHMSESSVARYTELIMHKLRAKTWADMVFIGRRILESETELDKNPEITQERAGRVHQMISAQLLVKDLSDENIVDLKLAEAKWRYISLERWRPVS